MDITKLPAPALFAKFVQILEDGTEFTCDLPIGPSFNDSTGVLFYVNRGFIPFDEFHAKKHAAEVKAKQEAEAKAEKKVEKK